MERTDKLMFKARLGVLKRYPRHGQPMLVELQSTKAVSQPWAAATPMRKAVWRSWKGLTISVLLLIFTFWVSLFRDTVQLLDRNSRKAVQFRVCGAETRAWTPCMPKAQRINVTSLHLHNRLPAWQRPKNSMIATAQSIGFQAR